MCMVVLVMNLAVSWAWLGIIWLVQLVIYPGFRDIEPGRYEAWHRWYTRRVSWVIMPCMLSELLLTLALAMSRDHRWVGVICLAIVLLLWLSTFGIQVPLHRRLEKQRDGQAIRRLIQTNWLRTALWTAKAGLLTVVALAEMW